jgi:hypothetical protein
MTAVVAASFGQAHKVGAPDVAEQRATPVTIVLGG